MEHQLQLLGTKERPNFLVSSTKKLEFKRGPYKRLLQTQGLVFSHFLQTLWVNL